jgi:uracil-DNA glycosylase family 4
MNRLEMLNELADLKKTVERCKACRLHEGRTNIVFDGGYDAAELAFVGEAPGATEDRKGVPFVGASGQKLDKMLHSIGLLRKNAYVCNVVKCRPPGNRTPHVDEVKSCRWYLVRQLELVRPKVIVALGATAMKALLGISTKISDARGNWYEFSGIPLMPTFHPAYLLREAKESPDDLRAHRAVWDDMRAVAAKLGLSVPNEDVTDDLVRSTSVDRRIIARGGVGSGSSPRPTKQPSSAFAIEAKYAPTYPNKPERKLI